MKARCNNKNHEKYPIYGGRGIIVCDEWKNSYEVFRDWALENGYKDDLTIDRRNNDGNYNPSNCRWVTLNVQARNKRRLMKNNTSGYRGVTWRKDMEKWRVVINVDKKRIHLGHFDYPYTGAYAYDSYVIKHNLEHTRNFS